MNTKLSCKECSMSSRVVDDKVYCEHKKQNIDCMPEGCAFFKSSTDKTTVYSFATKRVEPYPLPDTLGSRFYYQTEVIIDAIEYLEEWNQLEEAGQCLRPYEKRLVEANLRLAIKKLKVMLKINKKISTLT